MKDRESFDASGALIANRSRRACTRTFLAAKIMPLSCRQRGNGKHLCCISASQLRSSGKQLQGFRKRVPSSTQLSRLPLGFELLHVASTEGRPPPETVPYTPLDSIKPPDSPQAETNVPGWDANRKWDGLRPRIGLKHPVVVREAGKEKTLLPLCNETKPRAYLGTCDVLVRVSGSGAWAIWPVIGPHVARPKG